MRDLLLNLEKSGFVISSGSAYYKGKEVLKVISKNLIFISKELSADSSLSSLIPIIERCCTSSTVGNFSIGGEIVKVNGKVLISDMYYARLLADDSGYYIQMKGGNLNSGYLYSLCGVLSTVPWGVVKDMLRSL